MARGSREVLIVDDNADIRTVLRVRIGLDDRYGAVHEAETGALALAAAREHPEVGVVILDQEMPDGTGIDVLPELRAAVPSATIVMYTSDDSVHEEALRLGADSALTKPATVDRLLDLAAEPRSA